MSEERKSPRGSSPAPVEETESLAPPPMGDELQAELAKLEPVVPRRPRREFLLYTAILVPLSALSLLAIGIRQDLAEVSKLWLALVGLTWLGGFFAAAYLGIVPGRGRVLGKQSSCRRCAIALGVGFIALGLFATQGVCSSVPGAASTWDAFMQNAGFCTLFGIVAGVVPGALLLLYSRPTLPSQGRAMGLALGAAGASLAGLVLQMHCHVSERFHVAFTHGATVIIAAALLALIGQRLARIK